MQAALSRGDQTRDQIIQSAYQLFLNQGYHGTSMRQIAQHTNLALGGLYNHFANKEDIFRAVFFAYHPYREILPALLEARGSTPEAWVKDATRRILRDFTHRLDFLNLIFIESVEFKGKHESELITRIIDQIREIGTHFPIDDPRLRSIPFPMLLRTYVGMMIAYFLTDMILGEYASVNVMEGAVDHFVEIYLHGILNNPLPEE